ncbi:DUF6603 domain-containing protein [Natrialbaceae archaeon A-CW2]|uniref:DUF6603 domain-containing protein n=1 Tax=Natronosalvus amylolyticus TaxID=2961994 RepID=UPI0020C9AE67|nr:DUF6603 domain-containing protein [Natronosalvus amylolyticus]
MTDLDDYSTSDRLLIEVTRVFEPLIDAIEDAADGDRTSLFILCESVGIDVSEVEAELVTVNDVLAGIEPAVEVVDTVHSVVADEEIPSVEDVRSTVDAVKDIVEAMRTLDDLSIPTVEFEDGFGTTLLEYFLVTYVDTYHPSVADSLRMIGVIHDDGPGEVESVDFSQIPATLSDPKAALETTLEWGESSFDPVIVLYYLRRAAWELSLPARFDGVADFVDYPEGTTDDDEGEPGGPDVLDPSDDPFDDLGGGTDGPFSTLTVPALMLDGGVGSATSGIQVVPIPRPDGIPGLAIVPYGDLTTTQSFDFGDEWSIDMQASGGFDEWGIVVYPDAEPELRQVGDASDPPAELHGEITVQRDAGDDGTTVLGDPGAAGIALHSVGLTARIDYDGDGVSVSIALPTTGSISAHPDAFDGFLSKVLPSDGIDHQFAVTVGWSSHEGLFFERGGDLEVSIPQQASLGPVTFKEIYLSVRPGPDGEDGSDADDRTIRLTGAASANVEIGPATGTVTRMGLDAALTFPEDDPFPPELDLGFKPPDGIGLTIDTGEVVGGGYLDFDHENNRYAGTIQLHVGDITINAVGLLTTELPDGGNGFSLLVLIAGEFTPIELGLGFTLNGVGGLVGINRSIKTDPLREAVTTGSLDSVLFPQDVVANAQQIVSDLRTIFPPTRGTHVFGPMVRIGWGTPTLITGDLGVVLEIPSMKVTILGRVSVVLPDGDDAVINLNLNAIGVIDPEQKTVAIDATLYESRILEFTLSGDFAVRSGWGNNSRFILSAGGFHPAYDPPGDFPELDRVRASLGDPDSNLSIELSGFFAVTSNTAQVGGKIEAHATAGSLKAEGVIELKALFEFDPFKFVFDFRAGFSVTYKGKGVTLTLSGRLAGPTPWRVDGKVSFSIGFFSVSKSVNATIGSESDADALPPADVMSKLVGELEEPGNWSAQRPVDADGLVTVREIDKTELANEDGDSIVLVHPLGGLSFRQTVVPLDFRIETFGNARPARFRKFTIDGVAGASDESALDLTGVVTEQFAPGQYLELTDEEQLDSPAFESHAAGRKIETGAVYRGGTSETLAANTRQTTLRYETIVEDRRKDTWATPLAELGHFRTLENSASYLAESRDIALAFDEVGAVATGEARLTPEKRYDRPISMETTTVTAAVAAEGDDPTQTVATGAAETTVVDDQFVQTEAANLQTSSVDATAMAAAGTSSTQVDGDSSGDASSPTLSKTATMRVDSASDTISLHGTAERIQTAEVASDDVDQPTKTVKATVASSRVGFDSDEMADSATLPGSDTTSDSASSSGMETSARGSSGLSVRGSRYLVVDAGDMTPAPIRDNTRPTSKATAKRALSRHVARNPSDEGRYQVVSARRVRETATDTTEGTQ